jgi:hypothetical protein
MRSTLLGEMVVIYKPCGQLLPRVKYTRGILNALSFDLLAPRIQKTLQYTLGPLPSFIVISPFIPFCLLSMLLPEYHLLHCAGRYPSFVSVIRFPAFRTLLWCEEW